MVQLWVTNRANSETSVLRGCDRCANQHDCGSHCKVCTIVIDHVLLFEYAQSLIAKYLVTICPYITENHFFTLKASWYLFSPLKYRHSFLSRKGETKVVIVITRYHDLTHMALFF